MFCLTQQRMVQICWPSNAYTFTFETFKTKVLPRELVYTESQHLCSACIVCHACIPSSRWYFDTRSPVGTPMNTHEKQRTNIQAPTTSHLHLLNIHSAASCGLLVLDLNSQHLNSTEVLINQVSVCLAAANELVMRNYTCMYSCSIFGCEHLWNSQQSNKTQTHNTISLVTL